MVTGIVGRIGVLVSPATAVTVAIVCAGAVGADPSQDEHFLHLLEEKQIPAVDNVPGLISRAHEICGRLDDGDSFEAIRDEETGIMSGGNLAPGVNPARVDTTAYRFIATSVEAYCPDHQGQLP